MRKALTRLVLKQSYLLMSGYLLVVPVAGHAAENAAIVPQNKVVAQVAMNFGNSIDPVSAVIDAAEILGFNPKVDTFTLIKQEASQAVVQVTHNGTNFEVRLEAADGSWGVASMNSRM
jgi:hypothetical protein